MLHPFPTKASLGHLLLIESHKTTGSAAICGFMQELNGTFPGVKLLSVRRHVVIGRGE